MKLIDHKADELTVKLSHKDFHILWSAIAYISSEYELLNDDLRLGYSELEFDDMYEKIYQISQMFEGDWPTDIVN